MSVVESGLFSWSRASQLKPTQMAADALDIAVEDNLIARLQDQAIGRSVDVVVSA